MRIRVKAELILTVLDPRIGENAQTIALGVESRLNDLGVVHILTPGESAGVTTQVGVRVHINGIRSVEGIKPRVVRTPPKTKKGDSSG